jgi:L-alanine exporter
LEQNSDRRARLLVVPIARFAVVLFFVGADRSEIVLLLVSTAVLMFAVSRPFGLFLDAVRKVSGVT